MSTAKYWIDILLAISIIFLSNSSYGLLFTNIRYICIVLCIILLIIVSRHAFVVQKYILILFFIFLIVYFNHRSALFSYLHHFSVVTLALLLFFSGRLTSIVKYLYSFLVLLTASHVLLIFILDLGPLFKFETLNSVVYHSYLIVTPLLSNITKLNTVFWEPGVYCTFVAMLWILIDLVKVRRKSLWDIVLLFGLLLSDTVAGIIFGIILFVIRYFKLGRFSYLSALVVLALSWQYLPSILGFLKIAEYGDLSLKLSGDSYSVLTRFNSILTDIELFLTSPIIGVGYAKYFEVYSANTANNLEMNAQTTTLTMHLAIFGLFALIELQLIINLILRTFFDRNLTITEIVGLFIVLFSGLKEPNTFNIGFMLFYFVLCLRHHRDVLYG